MSFTEEQKERYSRHIMLDKVGLEGQTKINKAKVLLIGLGGLGSPSALYLAAAGVGTIGIVDADTVNISNLQRQVIHHSPDIDVSKVESASRKMTEINPDIEVKKYHAWALANNIRDIIKEYDFVIDATDNFSTKFLVNDACYMEKIPFCHGGLLRFEGEVMTIIPDKSACYRCAFPAPPPSGSVPPCSKAGVLGVICGVVGSVQATEALKYILGEGSLLTNTLFTYDALEMNTRKIKIKKKDTCPICGKNPTITELIDSEQAVGGVPKG